MDSNTHVVRESTDLNIIFSGSKICKQSNVWMLEGYARELIIAGNGTMGNAGLVTITNWFKIKKYQDGYTLVYCPEVCDHCATACGDIGVIIAQNGRRRLALSRVPFKGNGYMTKKEFKTLVRGHFHYIYMNNGARDFEEVISVLNLVVSTTMNDHLQSPVTNSEIYKATKAIYGKKGSRYFFEVRSMRPELNKTLVELDFMVNVDSVGVIKPQRGLRQGDPVSPYLFIIVADVLSREISKAMSLGTLSGSHPSWIWSSLLNGHDLLLNGLRWQVGNGQNISFWTQKQVSFTKDFYIRFPLGPSHNRNTVADYIEDGEWNVSMLREHILATEAEMVLQIPISQVCCLSVFYELFLSGHQPEFHLAVFSAVDTPSPPRPHGLSVKLNCDVAFKYSTAAFEIVVRDSTCYLHYVIGNPCHAISLFHVEIIAVHYACSLASGRGWLNATVKSDSGLAISLACYETTPSWSLVALVDDIRLWASNMQLSFSRVTRESNQVAHWVARHAFSTTSSFS
nr:hypothetical protein [Tanacetum cinerariifolium]